MLISSSLLFWSFLHLDVWVGDNGMLAPAPYHCCALLLFIQSISFESVYIPYSISIFSDPRETYIQHNRNLLVPSIFPNGSLL